MPQKPSDYRTLLKNALIKIQEMEQKLSAVKEAKTEPLAIIGMGCRFPGKGNNTPEAFWQFLSDGGNAITEVPAERWDIEAYYDPNPQTAGKMYTRRAGFLDQVDQFDVLFFGISATEAKSIDPQQRLLLEVSWEALEHAGQMSDKLAGSKTGVFIGIINNDYARRLVHADGLQGIDGYFANGTALNGAAGRISYTLGLRGPSMAIDTACSSSLVAIHLACQSLRNGECDQTLAGGVNLILSPESMLGPSQSQMLSPDEGKLIGCKTFDAAADGYVRAEGCGVLVLKRLSDAVADGDNILALIHGSAVNQDGASGGFTVPNGLAQQDLIRQALAMTKFQAAEVGYVETHGTGTPLGDPIEVRALAAVLSQGRSAENPLLIGAVKTNIGHLESAAGIAGLMKVVLALQHKKIPPHLHFNKPNPAIDWDKFLVKVTAGKAGALWPNPDRMIAGVSSFGASGTNAHVILEAAPPPKASPHKGERPLHLLALSAKDKKALYELAQRYKNFFDTSAETPLANVCYTAYKGRMHFDQRLSVVAAKADEMSKKLEAFLASKKSPGVAHNQVKGYDAPQMAFLFTGQGSQYIGMGQQLYETQPTFRQTLEQCAEILSPYLEQTLLKILYPDSDVEASPINETAYTQPALFAMEYALAKLWHSWGLEPTVVMGHSIGEYVAACIAGVFSLEDGLKLIATRGRLMQSLPAGGQMVSLAADETQVQAIIKPYKDKVSIAAMNGPQRVVISGEQEAIKAIVESLSAAGVKTRQLVVSHAFHSPLMEPILAEFKQVATEVTYTTPKIKLISNVTGNFATTEVTTPDYWSNHIREPVNFAAGMKTLHQQKFKTFVEIGPQPTLIGMGRHCLPAEEDMLWLPSLGQKLPDWQQMLQSLGKLYTYGISIDWTGFEQDYTEIRQKVVLPTYPFQRQQYWIEVTDWSKSSQQLPIDSKHPVVDKFNDKAPQPLPNQQTQTQRITLLEQMKETSVDYHHDLILTYLQTETAYLLGLEANDVPSERFLAELGFDSLMGMRLSNSIATELAITIAAETFLGKTSIEQLAKLLLRNLQASIISQELSSSAGGDDVEEFEL